MWIISDDVSEWVIVTIPYPLSHFAPKVLNTVSASGVEKAGLSRKLISHVGDDADDCMAWQKNIMVALPGDEVDVWRSGLVLMNLCHDIKKWITTDAALTLSCKVAWSDWNMSM